MQLFDCKYIRSYVAAQLLFGKIFRAVFCQDQDTIPACNFHLPAAVFAAKSVTNAIPNP
jgi:hypothetical protein